MLQPLSPRSLLKVAIITISVAQVLLLVYYLATAVNRGFRGTNTLVDVVQSTETQQGLDGSPGEVNIRPDSSEFEHKAIPNEGKFFIAFSYWEQFSMATSNLLSLTALAARSGRQVVVPFVNGSKFFGNMQTGTLERYYNISEVNRFLRTRGLATLVRWEKFQDTCKQNLDILLTFLTTKKRKNGQDFYPCDVQEGIFQGFKVGKTFCFDNDFGSLEILEQEVIKGLPCVGIKEWRGHGPPVRANFFLPSARGKKELHHCFNPKLEQIAKDFITNNLGPDFISMHMRLEQLVYGHGKNFTIAKKCLSEMAERVKETNPQRVFMAGDFSSHGSFSIRMVAARKHGAVSFYKDYLGSLNPITFQPSLYNLTDRGSVAIVEMIILSSGKKLFMTGAGSFGNWIRIQFQDKNRDAKINMYHNCRVRIPKSKRKF